MGSARCTLLVAVAALLAGCQDPVAPNGDAANPALGANVAASSLTATAVSGTQVDLVWPDNSRNEAGFEVHRSTAGSAFTLLASTGANVSSYSDVGLSPAVEYCYRVRPFKITGRKRTYSAFSNVACATPPNPPPAASDASAVPRNSNDVDIQWTDNASSEAGFRVERAPNRSGPWTGIATTGANQTWAADFVPSEQQVCYRVIAFAVAEAAPSNVDCTAPPNAPWDLTAETPDLHTVVLHWTGNSLVEDGYEVQRWDEVSGGWIVVAETAADAISYRDEGLTPDATYWYLLRAKKDGGYSYYSNYAVVTTASAPPNAPSDVTAFAYLPWGTVSVQWTDNSSNEDGFRVQRGPSQTGPWETVGTTGQDEWYFYEEFWAGQGVCYRVVAFNGRGESSPAGDCSTPPPVPTDLVATTVDHQAVDLSWTYNSTAADGFVMFRHVYPTGEFLGSVDLTASTTSYRDEGLESGTTYWYFVVATNQDGYSEYSNEAIATTDVMPGTDQTSTATAPPPSSARMVPIPPTLGKAPSRPVQSPSADRHGRAKPMCPSTVPLRHECPRAVEPHYGEGRINVR